MSIRLSGVDREFDRAQKSPAAKTSSAYTLTTSYADVNTFTDDSSGTTAVIALGGAPWITVIGTWAIPGAATLLTLKVLVSHDGTTFVDAPIHTAQTGTNGQVTAYPAEVKFNKADWGNANPSYCVVEARVNGFRFAKVQAKADNASGTLTLSVASGTGS